MVWNSVGVVKCINDESENSVDVEFHDTSVHHAIHITNVHNYTMADLSKEALVLARDSEGIFFVSKSVTIKLTEKIPVNTVRLSIKVCFLKAKTLTYCLLF